MEIAVLVLLAIAVLAIVSWRRSARTSADASSKNATLSDGPKITISVTTTHRTSEPEKVDTGKLTPTQGGFVLNPASSFPLTLIGASQVQAQQLKDKLDRGCVEYQSRDEIAFMFARNNFRCREIDDWVLKNRPRYAVQVEGLKRASAEWASASEPDRADLFAEFEEKALATFEERPANESATEVLLAAEPVDMTVDDELLARFDGNLEAFFAYLGALSRANAVQSVAVGDNWRRPFEQLVKMGLARRGSEIPLADLLGSLRVKDINAALEGVAPKAIGRKAKAIEFALTVPDIANRLAKTIPLRELFQVLPPPGLDVKAVGEAFEHAKAVVTVFMDTYEAGIRSLQSVRGLDGINYDSWVLESDNCCPACAKLDGKRFRARPRKLPPFHLGCRSWVQGDFESTEA